MEGIPEGAVVPEPEGEAATEAAVERLGSRFARLDGQVRHALRSTRDHAGNLSSDRLQGLSEKGGPLDPPSLSRTFTTLLRRADLRRIRFDDLRH